MGIINKSVIGLKGCVRLIRGEQWYVSRLFLCRKKKNICTGKVFSADHVFGLSSLLLAFASNSFQYWDRIVAFSKKSLRNMAHLC